MNPQESRFLHSLQRNVISGVITAGPFFITWLVFTFILGVLANAGLPIIKVLALPFPADSWLHELWFQYILAVLLTIVLFYVVGQAMSEVVGRQMLHLSVDGVAACGIDSAHSSFDESIHFRIAIRAAIESTRR